MNTENNEWGFCRLKPEPNNPGSRDQGLGVKLRAGRLGAASLPKV